MNRTGIAQGNLVSFELHTLGWKAFQDLAATIATEIWGQTVQVFNPTSDAGRDGAFYGKWKPQSSESFEGKFTIQCKFTSKREKKLQASELADEVRKATVLASKGLAETYIILTNASVTARVEAEIRRMFLSIPGVRHFCIYGGEWICKTIRESRNLRMLVPRIYGLGDLSQILDERAYIQATEILSVLSDDLAKFVITDAYRKSAEALSKHNVVLLLGEPASGKSTIAAALALAAVDKWNCSVLRIRNAGDFSQHWNVNEPGQFFWIDDAFGATQFDWEATKEWNRLSDHVRAAIKKGTRIVFTSRDYIFQSACNHLKQSSLPFLWHSQVVIHVEQLSRTEKEQILYNHIRLGTQAKDFKTKVKPFLPHGVTHARFLPEVARRLGDPLFTKELSLSSTGINFFFSQPTELLKEVVRTIGDNNRAALAIIFMRGGKVRSPVTLSEEENHAVELISDSSPASVRQALNSLNGSLITQRIEAGSIYWHFKHPTIRDAVGSLVAADPELLNIYLMGTPLDSLLREITCGEAGIAGVKVVVPPGRYDLILKRLEELDLKKYYERWRLCGFLARRCDKGFLQIYLTRYPKFVGELRIRSYLSVVSEVDVFARLHQLNILPEQDRQRFVNEVASLAITTPDAYFLKDESIRNIFRKEELAAILENVTKTLLPEFSDVISDWEGSYDRSSERPDEYFSQLKEALKIYRKELCSDDEAVELIDDAIAEIEALVERLGSDDEPDNPRSDLLSSGEIASASWLSSGRSVFDDVDD